jgi:hypothetical protein
VRETHAGFNQKYQKEIQKKQIESETFRHHGATRILYHYVNNEVASKDRGFLSLRSEHVECVWLFTRNVESWEKTL